MKDSVQRTDKTDLDKIVQNVKAFNLLTLKTLKECWRNINNDELKKTILDKIRTLHDVPDDYSAWFKEQKGKENENDEGKATSVD